MPSARAFAGLAALGLLLIWLQPAWTSCIGNDAAGCGMTQGFAGLIALALTVVAGLLALLFAVRRRPARVAAMALMAALAAFAGLSLLATVQSNLQAGATVTGRDPARAPPSDADRLRRAVARTLAFQRAADRHPDLRAEFEAAIHWFHGQVRILSGDAWADPLALAAQEGDRLADPDEAASTLASCADLESPRADDLAALLEAGFRRDAPLPDSAGPP